MKVLHYIPYFSLTSETFIHDFISYAACNSKNVIYILCHERANKKTRHIRQARLVQIKKFPRLPWRIVRRVLKNNWLEITKAQISRIRPDVVHIHFASHGASFMKTLNHKKIPQIVISMHGSDILDKNAEAYKSDLIAYSRQGVIFTVNSIFLRDKCIAMGFRKESLIIWPNAINPNFLSIMKETSFPIDKGSYNIACVGRLEEVKGHKYLIDAFHLFKQQNDNSQLILIGSGSKEMKLKEQVKKLGLENSVLFLGDVNHDQIPSILKKCNLYVQPSIRVIETGQEEAFGLSALEAIATGLPTILTETGGLIELRTDFEDCVFTIPEKDSNALFAMVKRVHANHDRIQHPKLSFRYSQENQLNIIRRVYAL